MIKLLRNSADVFIVQWKLVFIVLFHETRRELFVLVNEVCRQVLTQELLCFFQSKMCNSDEKSE